MRDAMGREFKPIARRIDWHTNRHRDNDGNSFGWIDGCDIDVIWSNGDVFNEAAARKFVNEYNARKGDGR